MATVLHVGFHKTGTTTLQNVFFPALEGCTIVSPNSRDVGSEFHLLVRDLVSSDEEHYSDAPMRQLLARTSNDAQVQVVSHEDLSLWHANGRTAERLHALAPDAKVLVCVREQRTMLYARYGQYVKKGGSRSFAGHLSKFQEDWLRYDVVVDDYQRIFGVDRVMVMPFEMLVERPASYFAELRAFVVGAAPKAGDVDKLPMVNRTLAPPTRLAVRVCNRLFVESDENPRPPLRGVAAGRSLARLLMKRDPVWFPNMSRQLGRRDRALAARYVDRYAQPNARLQRLTGLSLGEYGYVVDDDPVHAEV